MLLNGYVFARDRGMLHHSVCASAHTLFWLLPHMRPPLRRATLVQSVHGAGPPLPCTRSQP